jgi:hypothetical protein
LCSAISIDLLEEIAVHKPDKFPLAIRLISSTCHSVAQLVERKDCIMLRLIFGLGKKYIPRHFVEDDIATVNVVRAKDGPKLNLAINI